MHMSNAATAGIGGDTVYAQNFLPILDIVVAETSVAAASSLRNERLLFPHDSRMKSVSLI
jgi:hypothetical protein